MELYARATGGNNLDLSITSGKVTKCNQKQGYKARNIK